MADTLRSNKKVIIPVAAVIAAAVVGLVFFSPLSAIAQQSNSTNTGNSGQYSGTNMPTINGTINMRQIIKDQIKVSFSDAANAAAGAVSGGTVVAGHLGVVQGYLVYTFTVVNTSSNTASMVIVDAGNGHVLYQSQAHAIGALGHGFGYGGHMMMKHRFGGGMGMWQNQNRANSQMPAPQTQNGLSAPGWVQTQY